MDPLLLTSPKKKEEGREGKEKRKRQTSDSREEHLLNLGSNHSRKSHSGQEGTAEAKKGPGRSENEAEEPGV